ncbi:hypothetical protein [Paragemmobacter straminiformis]|uniref:Uncharacterized protein n=1 Tax=Paragemmobacter straminiformis TaxID=2045119 RepID=A0A842I8J5_9RHOB|nr:hypothetical protein [Gemmobacter straminiformis]MBC2836160.1 hypothetical protein [Gemmobacter straminiformis]
MLPRRATLRPVFLVARAACSAPRPAQHARTDALKTVVIFGAKPGSALPAGDAIYAANAAIMDRESEAAGFAEKTVVASALVMAKGLIEGGPNDALYRRKLETVRHCGFDRLVLFADPGGRDLVNRARGLLEGGFAKGTTLYSVAERRALTRRIGGCGYPVTDASFFRQPLPVVARDWVEIQKLRLGWLLGQGHKDARAKYRPSTGLLALLVAIAENGPDAHYVLSGIGLAGRNEFLMGGEITRNKANRADALPKHVQADVILLQKLAGTHRLSTTEPELSPFVMMVKP